MNNLPKIIDNDRKNLLEIFQQVMPEYDTLSIATGYWDLKGMQMVFDKIKNYKNIRLLIGREPLIPRHKQSEPEPDYPDQDIFYDLERMQPTPELKELVRSIKAMIEQGNLEVRVYRKNFLHAKCYIFGDYQSENGLGVIGSSNFTKNGLTANTELNALESDHRIVTFQPQSEKQEVGHLFWFDKFWNDPETEKWNGEFTELLGKSPIGDTLFNPYETYIKTLYELYREELEEEDLVETIKGSHELLDFQSKNVQALLRRLKKYKVAMLADSVGLGKTYTAIEVIKQYLHTDLGQQRVEIICPKSLKAQWKKEMTVQGMKNFSDPITLQNPRMIEERKELDNIASVSLFVIDESHNLKNRAGKRFDQIIEWIRNNPKAHVLLLTATPINNQLSDIVNQILLGTRGMADALKVTSVDKRLKQTVQMTFHQAIENLQKKIKQDLKRDGSFDQDHVQQVMAPIIRAFVVRRTRQGIEKEYGGLTIAGKERHFPKVIPEVTKYGFKKEVADKVRALKNENIDLSKIYRLPTDKIVNNTKSLLHPLDQIKDLESSIDDNKFNNLSAIAFVYQIILLLGFVPYRWQMYQTRYYGKTRGEVKSMKLNSSDSKSLFLQLSIYGILRTMFLKRLESSVSAIRSSLDVYRRKLAVFERGIEAGKIVSLKDLSNIEEILGIGDEDFNPDDITLDEEMELDTVDDKKYNLEAIKSDIQKERDLIDILDAQLTLLGEDDSKIRAFGELLEKLNNTQPAGKKVLVFSFYADTVEYLRESLPQYAKCLTAENSEFLSSKNRADSENLANRFAPIAKNYDIKEDETELDYLFSTDILSEGQNLQDCGILINYDLHWNPVRMIQRNGRVNRLGSSYDKVFIYNISPEKQLEEYLQLVERLEGKINLIKSTIGTDSPVLDEKENPIEFTDSLKDIYSEDMQKRIEAMEKAEREADFLLAEDAFVTDLKVFHHDPQLDEKYKKKIYNIPLGKWAIMPKSVHRGDSRPEVLSFNSLRDEKDEVVGHSFVAMQKDGSKFQIITNLQALEWLRTDLKNEKQELDNISLDKQFINEKTKQNISSSMQEDEVGAPLPTQTSLLRIMYENHSLEEDIEQVRLAFQTKNIIDQQVITKLVRKIVKQKKANEAFLNELKELVDLSYKTLDTSESIEQISHTNQILFYVKDNE
jgi:superfamily II DNA or RNA helicase